jgi:hypothetical protein
MDAEYKTIARKQANDHAEFMGEYTKYIYRHAHEHGFKHGVEYVQSLESSSSYLNACKTIAKSLHEEE